MNYYKILGIEKNSTNKETVNAYRKLSLKWHPNKNSNNIAVRMVLKKS